MKTEQECLLGIQKTGRNHSFPGLFLVDFPDNIARRKRGSDDLIDHFLFG
jgi:hypothetical protein